MDPVITPKTAETEKNYWCNTQDPLEFAADYFTRAGMVSSGSGYGYIGLLQLLSHQHYYGGLPTGFAGSMPSSAQVVRGGDQGENVELMVNWFRAHINAKHQIVVAPELTWSCQSTNTDSKSLAASSRGSNILEYMWKTGTYAQQAVRAVLGSILYGEEFMFTYWMPTAGEQISYDQESGQVQYTGDLRCFNVPSWDVKRDSSCKNYEDSPWLSAKLGVNRWDLIAQYPQYREEILKAASPPASALGGLTGSSVASATTSDKVVAHYFFHKRTPACPMGVQAVLLNTNCVLEFGALEECYWRLPIHRVSSGELYGTPYPYSDAWEALAIQDLATDIQGSLATNVVTFAKQAISAEEGTNLPFNQIGNGPMVIYRPKGSQAPVPIQLTASPKEAFTHLERLRADQRQILGLNDVALGEAPTGAPNAQAWALLSSAAITANSGLQRSYVAMIRSVGRSMLDIWKSKADYPQKVAIVGVHGAQVAQQEEFDKSTFAGVEDVMVEAANPLSQTAAGRLQLADMYSQKGFIQTPEQLQSVVETGRLDPLTQVLRDELIYIAWENEQILNGVNPPVKITDAHQMHAREHRGPTFSADARNNPEINQAADAHITAHLDFLLNPANASLLKVLGQAVPEAQQPGGGAPPAPGGIGQGAPTAGPANLSGMPPSSKSPQAAMESPMAQQQTMADIKMPSAPKNPVSGQPVTNNGPQS